MLCFWANRGLVFNNKDLIKRFGGELSIKPYKSFAKEFRDLFEEIDWHLLSKDKINEVLNEFRISKYTIWYYRSTKYKVCLLVNLFFWEYIYSTIGKDNIKYIDIGDIDKYVDYIFEDIFPDYVYPSFLIIVYYNMYIIICYNCISIFNFISCK